MDPLHTQEDTCVNLIGERATERYLFPFLSAAIFDQCNYRLAVTTIAADSLNLRRGVIAYAVALPAVSDRYLRGPISKQRYWCHGDVSEDRRRR